MNYDQLKLRLSICNTRQKLNKEGNHFLVALFVAETIFALDFV